MLSCSEDVQEFEKAIKRRGKPRSSSETEEPADQGDSDADMPARKRVSDDISLTRSQVNVIFFSKVLGQASWPSCRIRARKSDDSEACGLMVTQRC